MDQYSRSDAEAQLVELDVYGVVIRNLALKSTQEGLCA